MKKEAEILKMVLPVFMSPDLIDKMVISGNSSEPKRNRGRHFHGICEVRMLFGYAEDGRADYSCLRELRLTPAGSVHYGLDLSELEAHISIKMDMDTFYYLRGRADFFEIPVKNELKHYGVDINNTLAVLNTSRDLEHLRFLIGLLFSALAGFIEQGNFTMKNQVISKMCNYIHDNYCRSNLSVTEIAGAVGLSANYIQHLFHVHLQCTPREYLVNYRLEMARQLLCRHQYRIKEVAALCGWNCSHYFCNCYRKKFGHSPSQDMGHIP